MLKTNSLLFLAATAMMICGTANAQNCNSCGSGQSQSFGYPSESGCGGSCEAGGRFHGAGHARLDHLREIDAKVMARNDAWPKPFDCADRQLYFSMWTNMIDQGFEQQCVLADSHFDAETNELNVFGRHAVAGIMQNMPSSRKTVFINRVIDPSVSQSRLENVRQTVQTFYGGVAPNAQVAYSHKIPVGVSGTTAEGIQRLFYEGQSIPVIPISSGSESVSKSVN